MRRSQIFVVLASGFVALPDYLLQLLRLAEPTPTTDL